MSYAPKIGEIGQKHCTAKFYIKQTKGEQLVNHEKTIAVAEHRIKQSTSEIDDKMGKYDEVITNVQRLSSGNVK